MKRQLLALAALGTSVIWTMLPRANQRAALADTGSSLLTLHVPSPPRVWYPEETFRMGSSPEEVLSALTNCAEEPLSPRCPDFSNEQPQRTVTLSTFALDTQEVSVKDYDRCVAARRCRPVPYYKGARRFDSPSLPAVLVSHDDARSYCTFVGGDLPTEAQFERAARGLSRRTYPWGNSYHRLLSNSGRLAFTSTNEQDGTRYLAATRSYPDGATPEGVLNLAGNAAEWVRDAYLAYYDERDTTDPLGPDAAAAEPLRVVRGGSYLSPRVFLRGAARQAFPPDTRSTEIGFRCAYPAP